MRRLVVAAVASALATFTAVLSIRATNAVLAVAAVTVITVFVTWITMQHSTQDESGLALANPAWTLGLSIIGRIAPTNIVPLIAAQTVAAVLAGFAFLGLQPHLPEAIVWAPPHWIVVAIIAAILSTIAIWVTFAVDQQLPEAYVAIGPLLAGGTLPVGLTSVLNPAVIAGMAVTEVITWQLAGAAIASVSAGAIAGALLGSAITPKEP